MAAAGPDGRPDNLTPTLSIVALGGDASPTTAGRVAELAHGLRSLATSTELLVAGGDAADVAEMVNSASGELVVIWNVSTCGLWAIDLTRLMTALPLDGWEVAFLPITGRRRAALAGRLGLPGDPDGSLVVFRREVAQEIFDRLRRGPAPIAAALIIARTRGYRFHLLTAPAAALGRLGEAAAFVRTVVQAVQIRRRIEDLAEDGDLQDPRTAMRNRRIALRGLIVLDVAALGWWLVWLLNPHHAAWVPLYAVLTLAQLVNIFQVVGYWHAVWRLREPSRRSGDVEGRVDVFITTYDEPLEVVEPTLAAAVAMRRTHRTYLLDDGRRPEMGELAARYGATWLTRRDNRGHKAGNLNEALRRTDADFFAVFDCDHVPRACFLERLLPWFRDTDVAWVQAPQHYANRNATLTAAGAMDQQGIFFGPVCEGMDGRGGVICCGTNFVMRRRALDEVGGFREDSVTEDAATGLEMHARGWRSRYINEPLAEGLAPEDLEAFLKQQRRWAQGNLEMLVRGLSGISRLKPSLRLQYAWLSSNYLSGVSTAVYITLPCLYLLFGVQTVKTTSSDDFIAHFLPYIFLTIFIFVRSLDGHLRLRAIQVSFALFPIHLSALASAVTGRRIGFAVTPKLAQGGSAYHLILPQLAAIAISAVAVVVGLHRAIEPSAITNACWALFNIAMLSGIVVAAAGRRQVASTAIAARTTAA
jgi:cellulose synthase (UDP-forming)